MTTVGSTEGTKIKERFKNLLIRHGYTASENNQDIDHVIEMQTGGDDVYGNLWPLDFSLNQAGGRNVLHMKIPLAGGGIKKMTEIKQEVDTKKRKEVFFKIISTRG